MRHRRFVAALALLAATTAHANHFEYDLHLRGTFSLGGTDGCTPPDFNQPACPQSGRLTGTLSFDLPSTADGDFQLDSGPDGVSNLFVSLGSLSSDWLVGDIQLIGGVPSGNIQAIDGSEKFGFDWGQQSVFFNYDYGEFGANGSFTGTMVPAPEPASLAMMLAGLSALVLRRARARRSSRG